MIKIFSFQQVRKCYIIYISKEREPMKYAVCEEIIDGILTNVYTIRDSKDTDPNYFMVYGYFDTYEDAKQYLDNVVRVR